MEEVTDCHSLEGRGLGKEEEQVEEEQAQNDKQVDQEEQSPDCALLVDEGSSKSPKTLPETEVEEDPLQKEKTQKVEEDPLQKEKTQKVEEDEEEEEEEEEEAETQKKVEDQKCCLDEVVDNDDDVCFPQSPPTPPTEKKDDNGDDDDTKKNKGFMEKIHDFMESYNQPFEKSDFFWMTVGFTLFYILVFAYCEKTDIDYYGNIIVLWNAGFNVLFGIGYLATKYVPFAIGVYASFLASSVVECLVGYAFYNKRMFLSTYLHHILYSIFIVLSIFFVPSMMAYCWTGFLEISAFFQFIKRMWHIKSLAFDIFNAVLFFVIRIVLWIPCIMGFHKMADDIVSKTFTVFCGVTVCLHGYWSYTQWANIFKKIGRMMKGTDVHNNDTEDYMDILQTKEKQD